MYHILQENSILLTPPQRKTIFSEPGNSRASTYSSTGPFDRIRDQMNGVPLKRLDKAIWNHGRYGLGPKSLLVIKH